MKWSKGDYHKINELHKMFVLAASFICPYFGKCVTCVCLFVCFDLILYVPSTIFHKTGTGLPGLNQY